MGLSDRDIIFLKDHQAAAMITVGADGVAKVARVGVALVDGKLQSSGTHDRVRTRRLRGDPRCTLLVFGGAFGFMTLETTVTILDGPDSPALNLRLMREMQGKPTGPLAWFGADLSEEEFLETMVAERRLVYQFEVLRTYGLY